MTATVDANANVGMLFLIHLFTTCEDGFFSHIAPASGGVPSGTTDAGGFYFSGNVHTMALSDASSTVGSVFFILLYGAFSPTSVAPGMRLEGLRIEVNDNTAAIFTNAAAEGGARQLLPTPGIVTALLFLAPIPLSPLATITVSPATLCHFLLRTSSPSPSHSLGLTRRGSI